MKKISFFFVFKYRLLRRVIFFSSTSSSVMQWYVKLFKLKPFFKFNCSPPRESNFSNMPSDFWPFFLIFSNAPSISKLYRYFSSFNRRIIFKFPKFRSYPPLLLNISILMSFLYLLIFEIVHTWKKKIHPNIRLRC